MSGASAAFAGSARLRRTLADLRRRGEPIGVEELARRLCALRGPVPAALARRLVAAWLGHEAAALPARLEARQLRPAAESAVADVPLARAAFAVVDLETTGLSVESCEILEIGAVRVARLRPGARFTTLIRPDRSVPRRIRELTGIDELELEGAPPAGPALRAFRRWLGRAPSAPFVAHNAAFDARFTERALAVAALPPYPAPVLCTRRLARRLLPSLGRYDLDHLCARFGIRNAARHRALGDAAATARALVELLRLARTRGVATVGDLLDLQEQPTRRRRRRRTR